MKLPRVVASLVLSLAAGLAWTQGFRAGPITIEHPHARATLPGQPTGGAYLTLANGGADDRLVAVRADVSERVELHTMAMEGDVMRMRELDAIELPAGKQVALKPGGLHIMLIGLKRPLKAGERFPMTLRFENAGEVTVQVDVETVKTAPMRHDMKH